MYIILVKKDEDSDIEILLSDPDRLVQMAKFYNRNITFVCELNK